MIRERLQFHLKDLKSLDWTNESLPSPSYAVISLVKETSTLYRVISKLLPTDQVQVPFHLAREEQIHLRGRFPLS